MQTATETIRTRSRASTSGRKKVGRSAKQSAVLEQSSSTAKNRTINLRVDEKTKLRIETAASVLGESRSQFMVTSSIDRANEILLNRTRFELGEDGWLAFNEALDNPAPPNKKLKALLRLNAPWENQT